MKTLALIITLVLCIPPNAEGKHNDERATANGDSSRQIRHKSSAVHKTDHHPLVKGFETVRFSNTTQIQQTNEWKATEGRHRARAFAVSNSSNAADGKLDENSGRRKNDKTKQRGQQQLSRNYRRRVQNVNSTYSADVYSVLCANVTCKRKETCIVNTENNQTLCVQKSSRLVKPVRKNTDRKDEIASSRRKVSAALEQKLGGGNDVKLDAKRRAEEMKEKARSFEERYEQVLDARKTRLLHGNNSKESISSQSSNQSQTFEAATHDGMARGVPPCLMALKAVSHLMVSGAPLLPAGAYVPACDSDGFYRALQCSSLTGECWCSDHLGVEIKSTRVTGIAQCEE